MVTKLCSGKVQRFIFRALCGWKAWEEAGSQCGCRGDGRGTKELEQTEGEMGVPPISQIPTDHKQIHLQALKCEVLFRE